LADEVERTPTKQVLFRGNSIVTKALDYYQKVVSNDWLTKIQPVIDKIIADEDKSCEVTLFVCRLFEFWSILFSSPSICLGGPIEAEP